MKGPINISNRKTKKKTEKKLLGFCPAICIKTEKTRSETRAGTRKSRTVKSASSVMKSRGRADIIPQQTH